MRRLLRRRPGSWDLPELPDDAATGPGGEELAELEAELPAEALAAERKPELAPEVRERVEAELGDLLLAGAFLGKYLGIDPERATRESLRRFEARFRSMEEELGGDLSGLGLSELMQAWGAAKARLG